MPRRKKSVNEGTAEALEDRVGGADSGGTAGAAGGIDELIRVTGERMEVRPIDSIVPYVRNARRHDKGQIAKLRGSLRAFGFVKPVVIDEDGNLIAGHGILEAARAEGMTEVPCVVAVGLSEVDRQAYIHADNALGELSAWDEKMLGLEVKRLQGLGFDTGLLGLKTDKLGTVDVNAYTRAAPGQGEGDWFEDRERDEKDQEGNDEYNAFVEKFEAKKTTDDCYTPDIVYDAVADWTAAEYGLDRAHFVRPFYPGGDYQAREYGPEDVVVDNPPFSILAEILRFYKDRGVRFFLFAPALTLFSRAALEAGCCISAYADIVYENGANVKTSFVTNLEPEDVKARTAPALTAAVEAAADTYLRGSRRTLPKYEFPDQVLTAAAMGRWSALGIDFAVAKSDFVRISGLDAMKKYGKDGGIYGGALLLSEAAAADRTAADRAADERAAAKNTATETTNVSYWQLSQRELDMVRALSRPDGERRDDDAGDETAD